MKIGIYGAGDFCACINQEIPFIAVDGGIISLQKLGITPMYVVGDFDSVDFKQVENYEHIIQLPCRKDYADSEVAIQYAIELGYDEIELYGVTGGRLDHFFAVCRFLVAYQHVQITIYDDLNKIFILRPGTHLINKDGYDYISFYAIEPTDLSLSGFEYPLNHFRLTYENALCLSNEIIDEVGQVETDKLLYCIQAKRGND